MLKFVRCIVFAVLCLPIFVFGQNNCNGLLKWQPNQLFSTGTTVIYNGVLYTSKVWDPGNTVPTSTSTEEKVVEVVGSNVRLGIRP